MKKIVLFQPRSGGWDAAGIRPPDSLLAVAALPCRHGYEVRIIDQRTDRGWKHSLREALDGAVLCGITSMTGPQINSALEASRLVKTAGRVPVVWGGVHATFLPEQTLREGSIDYIVRGEGDIALLELAEALYRGDPVSGVPGISYKEQGIRHTPDRELIADLDTLLPLPYHLVDMDKYYGIALKKGRSLTLMTSRGCPFRCTFCYNTVFNRNTWRGMSAARVLEMIGHAVRDLGAESLFFEDDNFCADPKRFEAIVQGLLRAQYKVAWGLLGARVDTLRRMPDSLLQDAARAGCRSVDIGVESGDARMLSLLSKDIRLDEVRETNLRLAKYMRHVKYTFLLGAPTETEGEMRKTVEFAWKLLEENPRAMLLFTPYQVNPGTELFRLALQHGYREPGSLEQWAECGSDRMAYWRYPWLTSRQARMIDNYCFVSPFLGASLSYKLNNSFARLAAACYRPTARLRYRHNIYQFPAERRIAQWLGGT